MICPPSSGLESSVQGYSLKSNELDWIPDGVQGTRLSKLLRFWQVVQSSSYGVEDKPHVCFLACPNCCHLISSGHFLAPPLSLPSLFIAQFANPWWFCSCLLDAVNILESHFMDMCFYCLGKKAQSVFNLMRKYLLFQSGCTVLHFYQLGVRVLVALFLNI